MIETIRDAIKTSAVLSLVTRGLDLWERQIAAYENRTDREALTETERQALQVKLVDDMKKAIGGIKFPGGE